jgi:ABC-type transport system involved in multi-copper enzyme maturation permease subunit
MKALIQKELRENLKLAVLGLIIYSAFLGLNIHTYSHWMRFVAAGGQGQREVAMMQPLVSSGFWGLSGIVCAAFGAILGWFQIHNERPRDLWAFLVHRPATRTQIFFGKILAGLVLYILVAGLPLTGYLIWALIPGHVAAPFEWAMLRPVAVFSISGIVYYFAGMLTGLRQARWYASRALGLGAAAIVSLPVIYYTPHFWQALAAILIGSGILATAVWGGVHSNGFYRGQPAPGRLALVAALVPGCALISFFAIFLLFQSLVRVPEPLFPYYRMNKDGTIYKITPNKEGWPAAIANLDGTPLVDPKTGSAPKWAEFDQRKCYENPVWPSFCKPANAYLDTWFNNSCNRSTFWRETADEFWFYCNWNGRLAGYDKKTRQFIGSLGPDGFSKDLTGNGDHFDRAGYYEPLQGVVLRDARTIYQPYPEQRRVNALFTVTNENCEVAAQTTNLSDRIIGAVHEVWINGYDWNYTIVVTRCYVHLLAPDGKELWRAEPAYPEYNHVTVACLESNNQFALWTSPSWQAQKKSGGKLPEHVTWLDWDGRVLKSADLPELSYHPYNLGLPLKLFSLSLPPVLYVTIPLLEGTPWPSAIPWVLVKYSLMAALLCLPIGWWLGRRYRLPLPARLGWAAFQLCFGIPGLLAMLSVEEWPTREACPHCKKLRVVDREKCEHCGANFAPPETNGTEVFEPLTAVK